MKTRPLYLVLLFLFAAHSLRGEDVLARRLSVTFRETPLKLALDEVAKLAGFEWSYNAGILDAGRRISLSARDWTVREILQEMLGEGFAFKTSGHYLILKKQRPPKTELSGVIRDPNTGQRLANVTLYDRKTLRATTTDSSGYYRLKVKKKAEVVVARIGYRDTVLQVTSLSPHYQKIELSPVSLPPADTSSQATSLRKTLQQTATELDYFFAATRDTWHDLNVPDTLRRRFQISFLPKLGTNHVMSGKVENDYSINVLAGQSAGVRYFEAAGIGNFTQRRVNGFQAAGLFNINRGSCKGVQAAGWFNQTADTVLGVQLAGLVNSARHGSRFVFQASGLVSIIRKNDSADTQQVAQAGIQLGGLVNINQGKYTGLQAAGLYNQSSDTLQGVQVSGLVNHAQALTGVQVAGLVNTVQDMTGVQVSGLVNRTRRLRGVQIGVINHADEVHGLQIGLINRSGKRWLPLVNWGR